MTTLSELQRALAIKQEEKLSMIANSEDDAEKLTMRLSMLRHKLEQYDEDLATFNAAYPNFQSQDDKPAHLVSELDMLHENRSVCLANIKKLRSKQSVLKANIDARLAQIAEEIEVLTVSIEQAVKASEIDYVQDLIKANNQEDGDDEIANADESILIDEKTDISRYRIVSSLATLDYHAKTLLENEEKKASLYRLIEQSKQDERFAIGASNAISILIRAGQSFVNVDLSHVRIPGADLSGALLDHTNFSSANLRGVDFRGAFLRSTKFDHADLSGAQFGERVPLKGHADTVRSVAVSANGQMLASSSDDKTVRLWDIDSASCKTVLHHGDAVYDVAFSPDGKTLVAACNDHTVWMWSCELGEKIRSMVGHQGCVRSVAYSPSGEMIASGSEDKTIRLWSSQDGRCLSELIGHEYDVYAVSFSPDSRVLVSTSEDHTVRLWAIDSGECRKTIKLDHYGCSVSCSPSGRLIATGDSDHYVRLWDISSGNCIQLFKGHSGWVNGVTFSPDGKYIASAGEDMTVRLWSRKENECIRRYDGHASSVTSLAFTPDSHWLISAGFDNSIRFWSVNLAKRMLNAPTHAFAITHISASHGWRDQVASASHDAVIIWNASSGKQIRHFDVKAKVVSYRHDGSQFAFNRGKDVELYDTHSGNYLRSFKGHEAAVLQLAFTPDGHSLVSGDKQGHIRHWELLTGACILSMQAGEGFVGGLRNMIISPSGKRLFAVSQTGKGVLMDLETNTFLHKASSSMITTMGDPAYSPDESHLACANVMGNVLICDAHTGEVTATLKGHTDTVTCLAYLTQGDLLVSGSLDKTIRIWDLKSQECVKVLCGHTAAIQSVAIKKDCLFSAGDERTIYAWDLSGFLNNRNDVLLRWRSAELLSIAKPSIDAVNGLSKHDCLLFHEREPSVASSVLPTPSMMNQGPSLWRANDAPQAKSASASSLSQSK